MISLKEHKKFINETIQGKAEIEHDRKNNKYRVISRGEKGNIQVVSPWCDTVGEAWKLAAFGLQRLASKNPPGIY